MIEFENLEPWQHPYECAKCHDVIWSTYQKEFKSCQCGAISVDQTSHYERKIGNPEDFISRRRDIHTQQG